jgi:hypothetical protein
VFDEGRTGCPDRGAISRVPLAQRKILFSILASISPNSTVPNSVGLLGVRVDLELPPAVVVEAGARPGEEGGRADHAGPDRGLRQRHHAVLYFLRFITDDLPRRPFETCQDHWLRVLAVAGVLVDLIGNTKDRG